MGVVTNPPMAPSDVIVMVDPLNSSRVAVPSLAAAASSSDHHRTVPYVERFRMFDYWYHEACRCLCRDADMHAGMLVDDTLRVVKQRIQLGQVRDHSHHRAHQERQQCEPRLILSFALVQNFSKLLEPSHVDFFNIGDMRYPRTGYCHPIGDLAAKPGHLDVFDGTHRLKDGCSRLPRPLREECVQVFVRDATGRSAAGNLPQVDPRLPRSETNRRRGNGLLAFRTRGPIEKVPSLSGSC